MKKYLFSEITRIHFIGVGGSFMSALAKFCLQNGKNVSGSDRQKSQIVKELIDLGATVNIGHFKENIKSPDIVVYTSAIKADNPELLEAKRKGIKIYKRSEFLNEILLNYKNVIAVSGCHGKTTATCMIARAIASGGKTPTVFVGGEDKTFGNFLLGNSDVAVTEACEYKKNFIDIKPSVSVILNIELDHTDTYKNEKELQGAFKKFSEGTFKIINADDKNCKALLGGKSVTFGKSESAFYRALRLKRTSKGYSFMLAVGGREKFRVKLSVPGSFNVYNALAAFAAADALGVRPEKSRSAIENFTSVKRRTEFLGEYMGKKIYADYAHHPGEISAVIPIFPKDSLFIFQPHTYSRTKAFKKDFAKCFKNVNAVIYKTYAAREIYDIKGDAYTLYNELKKITENKALYAKNVLSLERIINSSSAGTVVFLGAGNIYDIAQKNFVDKFR